MADQKISELGAVTNLADADVLVVVDDTDSTTKKVTYANLKTDLEAELSLTASNVSDFDTEVANETSVAANTAARHTHSNSAVLDATTASFTTADETKLDGIETGADVTDTANVTAAGALMDSEVTNLADVKSFDPADYAAASHTHTHADITDYDTELAGKTNTTAFTPSADYHPATKKYVDDNAGSAPEGTAVLSTGETGGSKFLREDGDGTCSWQSITGGGDMLAANNLSDVANAGTARTNLGVAIGSDVQAHSAVLDATTASFTTADETKLDGIEASADVTDTTNVTAAGALMDSEVTNLAQVKAFDSSDYATAAQGTTADSAMQDLVDDTTPQLGGELDAGANSIGFTAQSATGDGATTIDWGNGNKFNFTFGAFNETFTFTAPAKPGNFILKLIQDGTGSRTATWPATVKWPSGTAPTLSTAASSVDICSFYFDGTNYYGVASLDFS